MILFKTNPFSRGVIFAFILFVILYLFSFLDGFTFVPLISYLIALLITCASVVSILFFYILGKLIKSEECINFSQIVGGFLVSCVLLYPIYFLIYAKFF